MGIWSPISYFSGHEYNSHADAFSTHASGSLARVTLRRHYELKSFLKPWCVALYPWAE
jgi:hypothetical protein